MRLAFNGTYQLSRRFGVYDPEAYGNYPGQRHPGNDWSLPQNVELVAGMSGWIKVYDRDPSIKIGRGKEVRIINGSYERRICHMNRIDVTDGQWVNEGDHIGLSGNTGYSSGPHVHDELLINGVYVDLRDYLKEEPMVNDGDIVNYYRAAFRREPTQDELAKNRKKPWNDPNEKLRAPLYGDMLRQFEWLWQQLEAVQKSDAAQKLQEIEEILKRPKEG